MALRSVLLAYVILVILPPVVEERDRRQATAERKGEITFCSFLLYPLSLFVAIFTYHFLIFFSCWACCNHWYPRWYDIAPGVFSFASCVSFEEKFNVHAIHCNVTHR